MLIENLPPTSAHMRAVHGTHWTEAEYLLAIIADHLAFSRYEFAKANGGTPNEPEPLRRPDDGDPEERAAEMRAAHDQMMAEMRGA